MHESTMSSLISESKEDIFSEDVSGSESFPSLMLFEFSSDLEMATVGREVQWASMNNGMLDDNEEVKQVPTSLHTNSANQGQTCCDH